MRPYWGRCKLTGSACSVVRSVNLYSKCLVYQKYISFYSPLCYACYTCELGVVSSRDEYLNPPSVEDFIKQRKVDKDKMEGEKK